MTDSATPSDDPQARSAQALQRFWCALEDGLAQGAPLKLVLARPEGLADDLQRVVARPLQLRGQPCLSLVYSHRTRDITKNLPVTEAVALLRTLLAQPGFRNAHLQTAQDELQLALSKRGKALLSVKQRSEVAMPASAAATATSHDREKQRWIAIEQPFLTALGVTTAQHQLVPAMARKWKQINKFVEVFAQALKGSRLADATLVKVADFGAGRGYLTFAIHDWLSRQPGVTAQVTGVELRPELVQEAQATIARLGLHGLRFEAGDVRSFEPGAMNVMIALHACDTATDHAIHLGLRSGADIILCSPCCH